MFTGSTYRLLLLFILGWTALVPAHAESTLSLDSAWELARAYSPQLQSARARIEGALAREDESGVGRRPQADLSVEGRAQGPQQNLLFGPRTVALQQTGNYAISLSINQNLADWGRTRAAREAAQQLSEAERAELQRTEDGLLEQVTSTYLEVLQAREFTAVAERNLKARRRALKDAGDLVEAGTAPKFDQLRAEGELAEAQSNHLESENRWKTARARLARLLGVESLPELNLLTATPPPEASVELPSERPALKAQRSRIAAATADIERIQKGLSPRIDLGALYQNQNEVGFQQANQWSVGLTLSIPILDGGLTRSQTAQARAALKQRKAELRQLEDDLGLELETLHYQLQTRWSQIEAAERQQVASAESLRIAELRYRSGLSTSLELLETQAAHRRAEQSWVEARYNYLDTWFRWRRAIDNPPWRNA